MVELVAMLKPVTLIDEELVIWHGALGSIYPGAWSQVLAKHFGGSDHSWYIALTTVYPFWMHQVFAMQAEPLSHLTSIFGKTRGGALSSTGLNAPNTKSHRFKKSAFHMMHSDRWNAR
jgi:hypothetical protein